MNTNPVSSVATVLATMANLVILCQSIGIRAKKSEELIHNDRILMFLFFVSFSYSTTNDVPLSLVGTALLFALEGFFRKTPRER